MSSKVFEWIEGGSRGSSVEEIKTFCVRCGEEADNERNIEYDWFSENPLCIPCHEDLRKFYLKEQN